MMARDNPIEPVLGVAAARFKAEEFTWLGTMSSYADDAYGLVIRADAPFKNLRTCRNPDRRWCLAASRSAEPAPTSS